jgi:hypothetical protein
MPELFPANLVGVAKPFNTVLPLLVCSFESPLFEITRTAANFK